MDESEKKSVCEFIKNSKEGLKSSVNINKLILRHNFDKEFKCILDEYEKKTKIYTYMITFTIDPKKHDVKDEKIHSLIQEYIESFAIARTPNKASYVKEGTDTEHKHTHWHLGLETKKYIDFSNFLKFYRKTYGSVDISKSWSNDFNNILIYISKSDIVTKLI